MSNTIKVKTYPMSQILNKITNKTTVVDQLILIASVHRKKRFKATPRNDMKKPHHLPISANCGGGSAYFRCMGKLNQAGKQRLSARIRFASANNIFNFAVCFRRPRYRVFRYRNRPFTTPKTCSTFARTDDFSCSLRFN